MKDRVLKPVAFEVRHGKPRLPGKPGFSRKGGAFLPLKCAPALP
jgi:hypothetical protein